VLIADPTNRMTIFLAPNCNTLSCIAQVQGRSLPFSWDVVEGERYYLVVDGVEAATGTFNVTVQENPTTPAPSVALTVGPSPDEMSVSATGSPIQESPFPTDVPTMEETKEALQDNFEQPVLSFSSEDEYAYSSTAPPGSYFADSEDIFASPKPTEATVVPPESSMSPAQSTADATLEPTVDFPGTLLPTAAVSISSSPDATPPSTSVPTESQSVATMVPSLPEKDQEGTSAPSTASSDTVGPVESLPTEVSLAPSELSSESIAQAATLSPENDSCDSRIELELGDSVAGNTLPSNSEVPSICVTSEGESFPSDLLATGTWYSVRGTGNPIRISFLADHGAKVTVLAGEECESLQCLGEIFVEPYILPSDNENRQLRAEKALNLGAHTKYPQTQQKVECHPKEHRGNLRGSVECLH